MVTYAAISLSNGSVAKLELNPNNTYAIVGVRGDGQTMLQGGLTLEECARNILVVRENDGRWEQVIAAQE